MSTPSNLPPVLRPTHPPARSLRALAEVVDGEVRGLDGDVTIGGLTLATADLRPGEAFVAIRGVNRHGAEVATDAAARGAVAVITDAEGAEIAASAGLPIVVVDGPRARLGALSAWVYGTGADDDLPLLFATTGTNGKTSTSHLLEGILGQLGVTTGLSSTAERHIAGRVIVSRLTTPEASEFHALLALMREEGVEAVAVEVSAQALSRHRVDGLMFDIAGFTNLSHDHLDDYADMREYLEAKLELFRPERARQAVIALDSPYAAEVTSRSGVPFTTIGTPAIAADPALAASADWTVEILAERQDGTDFTLRGPEGRTLTTTVPTIGRHMAANAGLAIAMIHAAGYDWERIVAALDGRRIEAYLPGRTERVSGDRGPAVYVDFGHSPDAFEKTLAAVRHVTPGTVLMLFGADGDRDATKRHDMGRTAVEGSDILVITDHHPRRENPDTIRATLLEGARRARPDAEIHEYSPPERAIIEAVKLVGEGDAILWAGPGHQDYRDIRGVRTPYSARELARRALRDAGWPVPEPHWPVPYPTDTTPASDPERPAY
ncbi:MAG: UDP-N-acetylmuramoyl-L-alanyl-D-glutamate--2,6-diaminopimelate ligase [Microbacterium ginsengisoli]|uniref:Mur ligase family protein n=1 Tax=Microbacterium TaxID=33882 RepID=UPI0006F2938D|nr:MULTISPECIES: UDP-N-acetylmuramoyl-L-alanyl-D-glutamate--2,6-diaminopimelate ligase [unclassified Microbacterium]MBN9198894.1 UDP-N-acetylmuramoyl-L-alanyl-D-glutamate--2,6-diaminopimelate ligase [Microbacterium ginsengisoli]KQR92329.1 UDP-N-acetylmuramyl peptide synthase [Microbacterium sp. Leaf351]KQR92862.1 UDP-N-acetylmuramyl peptide synthase [Microbacterium sp. Leaf347]ODU78346.1 MAG: UDP-N-acetylmuramyl peptide synthase [Microbacterium sp. SCN 71-21]OJU76122.1 MAG: UDP-N-acetylmuramyl